MEASQDTSKEHVYPALHTAKADTKAGEREHRQQHTQDNFQTNSEMRARCFLEAKNEELH